MISGHNLDGDADLLLQILHEVRVKSWLIVNVKLDLQKGDFNSQIVCFLIMVVFYLHLLSLFLIFKVFVDLFLRFLHLLLDDLFALLQVGIGSLTAPNIEEVECLQIVVQSCRRVIL